MSLETEIKNLTNAVKTLTHHIQNMTSNQMDSPLGVTLKIAGGVEQEGDQLQRSEAKTYTHQSVKELILELNREDPKRKPKLKALLETFGATKVSDIKENDLQALVNKLEAGEY